MLKGATGASGPAEIVKSKRRKCFNFLTAQLRSSSFETPKLLNEDSGALHSVPRTYASPHFCNSESRTIDVHTSAIRSPEVSISASLQVRARNYASSHSRNSELGNMAIRNPELCITAFPLFGTRNYAFPHAATQNPELCTTAFPQFGLRNHASPHRSISAMRNNKSASMKFLSYTKPT